MHFKRNAGILLHPTSLPGKFGIGDLGSEAYRFIDLLKEAGQTLWQVFPLDQLVMAIHHTSVFQLLQEIHYWLVRKN